MHTRTAYKRSNNNETARCQDNEKRIRQPRFSCWKNFFLSPHKKVNFVHHSFDFELLEWLKYLSDLQGTYFKPCQRLFLVPIFPKPTIATKNCLCDIKTIVCMPSLLSLRTYFSYMNRNSNRLAHISPEYVLLQNIIARELHGLRKTSIYILKKVFYTICKCCNFFRSFSLKDSVS